eukprot:1779893-Rhodomonas_salina.2
MGNGSFDGKRGGSLRKSTKRDQNLREKTEGSRAREAGVRRVIRSEEDSWEQGSTSNSKFVTGGVASTCTRVCILDSASNLQADSETALSSLCTDRESDLTHPGSMAISVTSKLLNGQRGNSGVPRYCTVLAYGGVGYGVTVRY